MKMQLIDNIFDGIRNNNIVQSFLNELKEYLDKTEDFKMEQNEEKFTIEFRDKMNLKKNEILIDYAKKTENEGQMYYIYSENSKADNLFNLCICEEGQSHIVIEESKENLPDEAKIGSVLRKIEDRYVLDEEGTIEIENQVDKLKEDILMWKECFQ